MSYKPLFITQEHSDRSWMQIEHEGFTETMELPEGFKVWSDKNQQDWVRVNVGLMIDRLHAARRHKIKLVSKKADA